MINVRAFIARLKDYAEQCGEHDGRPVPVKRDRERLANLGFIVSQLGGLLAGLGQAMTAAAHDEAERAAAAAHDEGFASGSAARADVDRARAAAAGAEDLADAGAEDAAAEALADPGGQAYVDTAAPPVLGGDLSERYGGA